MILEEAVNCRHIRAFSGEWSERLMTRGPRLCATSTKSWALVFLYGIIYNKKYKKRT